MKASQLLDTFNKSEWPVLTSSALIKVLRAAVLPNVLCDPNFQ